MLTPTTILARNPEIIANAIDDEIVMMSIEEGSYFGLNSIGSIIWQELEEAKSIESIISILLERFDVEEQTCREETIAFIENMIKNKTLVITE